MTDHAVAARGHRAGLSFRCTARRGSSAPRPGFAAHRPTAPRWFSVAFLCAFVLGLPAAAHAQPATGTITGSVVDEKHGQALAYAHVMVLGTTLGASSREDGTFEVVSVPVGSYRVQVSFIGYESQTKPVAVAGGSAADVRFRLKSTLASTEKEVVVTAERPLVDVKATSSIRAFNSDEISSMTLQPTLDNLVEQQPGVTRDNDKIHIRGGRSDETLYIVDGVQMRDLISGDSKGTNVSARSIAEVNIITGGFDAKYGQALSGVIEAKTKEGGETFRGWLGYQTDRFTGDEETDIWEFELGGPAVGLDRALRPLGARDQRRPTFFLSLAVDMKNRYLPGIDDVAGGRALRSSYREGLFGLGRYGSFFYPRGDNNWRANFKTTWQASAANKYVFAVTKSLSFDQGFNDTDVSEVNRNVVSYPWSYRDTFHRYYTVTSDQNSMSLTWIRTFRPEFFHTAKVTRFFSSNHQDVAGKRWDYYDVPGDSTIFPRQDPYFRNDTEGDATSYRDRFVKTWSLDSDWVRKWRRHDIRWGGRAQYETVQYFSLDAATVSSERPLGKEYDLFNVTPTTGAFYLQDQFEQEGLIAKIGLRYDYWFPGEQVERLYEERRGIIVNDETEREWLNDTRSLFGRRFKGHLSPRLEVSHPITDRDNLFFNYGHFSQRPPYFYVYAKTGSQSAEEFPRIGNPNLNPEISVQYELGAGHTFRRNMAAKVTLFFKDIYDYPTSTTIQLDDRGTTRSSYFIYFNRDYARSRGVELELRRRSGGASWTATYSYSVVKGKSSDPNALALVRATGGDARETSLDEESMWWNRPHKLTLAVDYRVPRGERVRVPLTGVILPPEFALNFYYLLQSGRAFTPADLFGLPTGPEYSQNGPWDQSLNGTVRQSFRFGGHKWELSVQGWNLLDHRNVLVIDPVSGDRYRLGEGAIANSTADPRWLAGRYSDPAMRSAPRNVRLGLGVEL